MGPDSALVLVQILINSIMLLVVLSAFFTLISLNRAVRLRQLWLWSKWRALCLLIIFAYSLPSWWYWGAEIWAIGNSRGTFLWGQWQYTVIAILNLYPAGLCICLLYLNKMRHRNKITTEIAD